jgi:hypothetical protein
MGNSLKEIVITGRTAQIPGGWKRQPADAERKAQLRARGRVRKRRGERNETEAEFERELLVMRSVGAIVWYAFQAITLRLADDTTYTPDFAVQYPDGLLRLIDVKGTTKTRGGKYKPFVEEDAKVKAKVAAEQFPIAIAYAYKLPAKAGGMWRVDDI